MKIGLLGGSFNPIHNGHIALAETVKIQLSLNEVWFIPTGNHPFKKNNELLDLSKRLDLISKVISLYPSFKISLLDSEQDRINYTYNLIKRLKKANPDHEFFFLIGSDILKELTLWHKYKWLLENIKFVIIKRPGSTLLHDLDPDQFNKLVFVNMQPVPISSTEIRDRIKKDQPIKGLVSDIVETEIYNLYRNL